MRLGTAGLVVVAGLLSACGSSSTTSSPPPVASPPATLPARAVPYLPSTLKPLTATLLTREAQAPDLAASLRTWGFQSGSDRYFQGESHRLQVVESRTLRSVTPPARRHMSPSCAHTCRPTWARCPGCTRWQRAGAVAFSPSARSASAIWPTRPPGRAGPRRHRELAGDQRSRSDAATAGDAAAPRAIDRLSSPAARAGHAARARPAQPPPPRPPFGTAPSPSPASTRRNGA